MVLLVSRSRKRLKLAGLPILFLHFCGLSLGVSINRSALDWVVILGVFKVQFSEAESAFTLLIFIDFQF